MSFLTRVFLIVVLVASVACAADLVTIHLLYTAAKQDSPLQITGFRLPDHTGGDIGILLHNATSKEIISYDFVAPFGDPRPVSGTAPSTHSNIGSVLDRYPPLPIEPQGNAQVNSALLRPINSVMAASDLGSNCIQVAVLVSDVKFSDGAEWKAPGDWAEPWRASIRPESVNACEDNGPDAVATLKRMKGGALGSATVPPDAAVVEFYTDTCPVRLLNGLVTAFCDYPK